MDATNIATIFVATIAALSAYASQRAAARAAVLNTSTTSRVDMEREAYERARKFDIDTIERQDREIAELRGENEELRGQVLALRLRVATLENNLPPEDTKARRK